MKRESRQSDNVPIHRTHVLMFPYFGKQTVYTPRTSHRRFYKQNPITHIFKTNIVVAVVDDEHENEDGNDIVLAWD